MNRVRQFAVSPVLVAFFSLFAHAQMDLALPTLLPKSFSEHRVPAATVSKPPAGFSTLRHVRVRDITGIEGVRDNMLIGYGLVVGLNGRGDSRQTFFTTQMLANVLQRMGMQVPASQLRVNNVAAVFVTAVLPPFSRSGTQLDV